MRRIAAVVNAGSGSRDFHDVPGLIAGAFAVHGVEPSVAVVPGGEIGDAARHALQGGASVVVAGGGDGTVSTVASVLAGTGIPLGVLPFGTLNHFARDLRIPLEMEAAVGTIAAGHSVAVDVGEVNGRYFINNASLGLYPRLVWEREKERRAGRGKLGALAVAAVRTWQRYRRVHVIVNNGEQQRVVRTPFVFVGNNEYELEGLEVGRRERVTDGRLQVCTAPDMTRMELVRVVAGAFTGRLRAVDHFESLCATECSIQARSRRQGVTLDGELYVMTMPLLFRTHPGMLRVLVPES
jgi:diacylglycerol kinase family enzyme